MSFFEGIENKKYRFVLDLKEKDEAYDKKRSVISGEEAFKLCYNRYLLMQQILMPLKNKIGGEVDVTDISLINGIDDDMRILIRYKKGEKNLLLDLSSLDYQDVGVISSDTDVNMDYFGEVNRGIINKTFIDIRNNSLDEEIIVKSTTGKFIIKDNCDCFTIRSYDDKVFSMDSKYSDFEKKGSLLIPAKIECNFPKLKELLQDENNRLALYQHLYIYEDVFPKKLIKKLTNC